jgi:hypothetical protein
MQHLLNKINNELINLGMEYSSPNQICVYLTRISSNFYNLVKASIKGAYAGHKVAFFYINYNNISVCLRVAIHMKNKEFTAYMR